MYISGMNGVSVYQLDLEIKDGDSNEVCTAKYMVRTFIETDGDSQHMTHKEQEISNLAYEGMICAIEVLRARDELRIKS